MKIAVYILMALAVASLIYNFTLVDFNAPLNGDSQIAIVGILASLCVLVLLSILQISYKIKEKQQDF